METKRRFGLPSQMNPGIARTLNNLVSQNEESGSTVSSNSREHSYKKRKEEIGHAGKQYQHFDNDAFSSDQGSESCDSDDADRVSESVAAGGSVRNEGNDSGRGSGEGQDQHKHEEETSDTKSNYVADESITVRDNISEDTASVVEHVNRPIRWSDDDLSDSSLESQGLVTDTETGENEIKPWDVFTKAPYVSGHEGKELCYAVFRKILKVLTCIFLCSGFLCLIILSKGSLLVAISNIRPFVKNETSVQPDVICKFYEDIILKILPDGNFTNETIHPTKCLAIPRGYEHPDNLLDATCLERKNFTGKLTFKGTQQFDECFVVRNYWVWSVLLMICTPYVFVFLRCFWRILFKRKKSPTLSDLLATLVVETLHAIGVCILVFVVLPSLDNAIQALIFLLGVATIPSTLKIFVRPPNETRKTLHIVVDCLAFLTQVSLLVVWPVMVGIVHLDKLYDSNLIWSIPVSLTLVSVRWWENFVDKNSKLGKYRKFFKRLSDSLHRSRTKTQLMASIWKIAVSIVTMMFCVALQVNHMDPLANITNKFTAVFDFSLSQCNETTISGSKLPEMELDWVWVWLVNCCASLVCYFFARSAAKVRIQQICYALPLVISTPLMFGMMVGGCELWNNNPCSFATNELSGYLFYKCYEAGKLNPVWYEQLWFLLPVWWLSQLWIAWHIWFPKCERLARADKLFVLPLYDGVLMEQSLLLNRKRNDEKRSRAKAISTVASFDKNQNELTIQERSDEIGRDDFLETAIQTRDEVPFIYICATMWHETPTEMIQMLKSIFRLDIDQAVRKNVRKHFSITIPDYYEFEAHIFFDNAFDNDTADDTFKSYGVNEYVQQLVSVVAEAATSVHGINVSMSEPIKYPTPYGGRLVWSLPGANKLIVHLKDNAKIRHKKRWSQVMYMYYFLGQKLWVQSGLPPRRRQIRAENTFLLALDGDVDFEPNALHLLVDLMKRDSNLGAACGRIHPSGSGPMVWYQKFEYALGHWMQKATEHVIGCVLCSPGCFSLFRGLALMEENVMAKYTTQPTEPAHFIQYDQGEDRWLCTLILQKGYRVEYCAASDSFTFAPEGFNEFFNQRRRWMPSTMANVYDLLSSWKTTTAVNENISLLYIVYQAFLLGASIVGPGTIFMMMVGSMALAVKSDITTMALINAVPVVIFVILCFVAKSEYQLLFAQLLTGLYCLIQMLVLIGILVEMGGHTICYPTTVFFLFIFGTFVLCAVIHPQESINLTYGFVYYMAIPTMYMLLMIYAMTNLHVVSWGTREVQKTPTEKRMEEAKQAEAEEKKQEETRKKSGFGASLFSAAKKINTSDRCNKANCCSLSCCSTAAGENDNAEQLRVIIETQNRMESAIVHLSNDVESLVSSKKKNERGEAAETKSNDPADVVVLPDEKIEKSWNEEEDKTKYFLQDVNDEIQSNKCSIRRTSASYSEISEDPTMSLCNESHCPSVEDRPTSVNESVVQRDDLRNPYWAEDAKLGGGPIQLLPKEEIKFFQELIKKYLQPLIKDQVKEERDAAGLKDLRNRIAVAFLLLNAIFVVVVFVMQSNTSIIYIPWPCGDDDGEDLKVEPIGFMFMMVYGLVIIIQVAGMIMHRTSTFLHIMATTNVNVFTSTQEDERENLLALGKRVGRLDLDDRMTFTSQMSTYRTSGTNFSHGGYDDDVRPRNRQTCYRIERNAKRRAAADDEPYMFSEAFERGLERLGRELYNADGGNADEIQKKLLGGANAGYALQRKTAAALQTLRERKYTFNRPTAPPSLSSHGRRTFTSTETSLSADYADGGGEGRYSVGRRGNVRFQIGKDSGDDDDNLPEPDYY